MKSGIYYIKNIINGKIYVGSSANISGRWKKHLYSLRKNKHWNKHLQNAWNMYGESKFEFIIIEECIEQDLTYIEQFYIEKNIEKCYNYNTETVAFFKGRNHTDESKKLIGNAAKGRILTEEHKNKIRISKKRYLYSII